MTSYLRPIAFVAAMVITASGFAEEPPAEKVDLKDGSALFLHPDGTGRMIDQHGKPMSMSDGVAMEAKDGRVLMMMNKHVWMQVGPPGKGPMVHKMD